MTCFRTPLRHLSTHLLTFILIYSRSLSRPLSVFISLVFDTCWIRLQVTTASVTSVNQCGFGYRTKTEGKGLCCEMQSKEEYEKGTRRKGKRREREREKKTSHSSAGIDSGFSHKGDVLSRNRTGEWWQPIKGEKESTKDDVAFIFCCSLLIFQTFFFFSSSRKCYIG